MNHILIELAKNLNNENILWGVGGSVLLKSYGIIDEVHDIDILISKKDIKRALEVLDRIAVRQEIPMKDEYKTEYFYVYMFRGVSIDVMSSFRINHINGIYEFILDKDSIVKKEKRNDVVIPYSSLEDWFIAYKLMIGRENKVKLIEKYLTLNGILHVNLLIRALDQALPDSIRNEIEELVKVKSLA